MYRYVCACVCVCMCVCTTTNKNGKKQSGNETSVYVCVTGFALKSQRIQLAMCLIVR